jgi:AcrR family transcriptional regulator
MSLGKPPPRTAPHTFVARTARSRRTRAALVAAVHAELRSSVTCTAERVAAVAGCSEATYYAHFPTKDDAVAEAFGAALDALDELSRRIFVREELRREGPAAVATRVERELVRYFRGESLVFRAALARLPEHRGIRERYRQTERTAIAHLHAVLEPGPDLASRAEAALVISQGVNNPRLLRAPAADPVHAHVATALATVLAAP